MGLSTYKILKNVQTSSRIELSGETLKDLQRTLLEILQDFADICKKYGFYYSICGGTALGAVRHGGFIPWDDDIDVFMLRKDYEKFLEIFKVELSEKYYLKSMETTPEIGMPITQLMKRGTIFRTTNSLPEDDTGVYIDICILDNAPDNIIIRTIHGIISDFKGLCLSCARFYWQRTKLLDMYVGTEDKVLKVIKTKIRIGKLLSYRSLDEWATSYSKWNARCKNNKSEFVVCPTGIKHYFGEIFPRKIYCVTVPIKFENSEFQIIENYDWALKRLYGDYMQIPPEDKRETHFVLELKL